MENAVEKAYEITDAKITFVSLVDRAANKRKFLLTKAEDGKASFRTCRNNIEEFRQMSKYYIMRFIGRDILKKRCILRFGNI